LGILIAVFGGRARFSDIWQELRDLREKWHRIE
jgi:hypothetical protein